MRKTDMREDISLGVIEGRFADIVWAKAPISCVELVRLAAEEMKWKRTTTYTVIKKLCDKELFTKDDNGIVTALVSREEYLSRQGEQLVDRAYGGSLPMFIAGFVNHRKLSQKDIDEIKKMLDDAEEAERGEK